MCRSLLGYPFIAGHGDRFIVPIRNQYQMYFSDLNHIVNTHLRIDILFSVIE